MYIDQANPRHIQVLERTHSHMHYRKPLYLLPARHGLWLFQSQERHRHAAAECGRRPVVGPARGVSHLLRRGGVLPACAPCPGFATRQTAREDLASIVLRA